MVYQMVCTWYVSRKQLPCFLPRLPTKYHRFQFLALGNRAGRHNSHLLATLCHASNWTSAPKHIWTEPVSQGRTLVWPPAYSLATLEAAGKRKYSVFPLWSPESGFILLLSVPVASERWLRSKFVLGFGFCPLTTASPEWQSQLLVLAHIFMGSWQTWYREFLHSTVHRFHCCIFLSHPCETQLFLCLLGFSAIVLFLET